MPSYISQNVATKPKTCTLHLGRFSEKMYCTFLRSKNPGKMYGTLWGSPHVRGGDFSFSSFYIPHWLVVIFCWKWVQTFDWRRYDSNWRTCGQLVLRQHRWAHCFRVSCPEGPGVWSSFGISACKHLIISILFCKWLYFWTPKPKGVFWKPYGTVKITKNLHADRIWLPPSIAFIIL